MSGFDSIIHSMTTISTGGFSSHNQSFAYFNSQSIENISINEENQNHFINMF